MIRARLYNHSFRTVNRRSRHQRAIYTELTDESTGFILRVKGQEPTVGSTGASFTVQLLDPDNTVLEHLQIRLGWSGAYLEVGTQARPFTVVRTAPLPGSNAVIPANPNEP